MTKPEKFAAITARTKGAIKNYFTINYIMIMWAIERINDNGDYTNITSCLTPLHKRYVAIFEEFGWEITNREIISWLELHNTPKDQVMFVYRLIREQLNGNNEVILN